ncbi:MAG: organomercurial lyase [Acidimicrobiales bacterium]
MAPTIEEISTAFVDGFVPLTADEQRLAQTVYRLVATGRPASPAAIAAEAGWRVGDVEARLNAWPMVFRNGDGAVVGFWGLAAEPVTGHRMEIDGIGTAWTWCSYDTLFIPHLLGVTARVTSPCPTTGRTVRLTVCPHGIADVDPADAVLSLLTPDRPFDDDVRQTFCHYILFFASPGAAEPWIADNPGTLWLPVADAFEVAGRANAGVFPSLVGAGTAR